MTDTLDRATDGDGLGFDPKALAAKYRQELSEVELGWLYRLRTLLAE